MQLLIMVLNKTECLDRLLAEFIENDIRGATILDSTGLAKAASDLEILSFFGSFNMMGRGERHSSKTLFMALDDEKIKNVIEIADRIVGGIDNPDTCFIIVLPVTFVKGSFKSDNINGENAGTTANKKKKTDSKEMPK